MFIELVDHLRCVRPHEDSWLVAASRRMDGRHIVEGVLGCPVCRAEYPVRDGVADFRADATAPRGREDSPETPDGGEAMRLAALLALVDVRAPVVLAGAWGALAPALLAITPAVYLVVNPAAPVPERTELSALLARGALPVAAGAAHGVALDDGAASDAGLLAGAVRALRPAGRLVAPVGTTVPDGVRELARDERHWVAERAAAPSAPVALRMARR